MKRIICHIPKFRYIERIALMSYTQLFALWASLTLAFAMGYFLLSSIGDTAHHGPRALVEIADPVNRLWNSLYFSVITATSTGYGDITPNGFSKALAAVQSISALFIFAIFVTKLVSRNQETALREVHRLTFEDVFQNMREGFFIMRKDFDEIITKLHTESILVQEDWDTLIVALKQGQSLIGEIPDFYNNEHKLYVIDARREELMQEAVHRTMHRINSLVDALSRANIAWSEHQKFMKELRALLQTLDTVTSLWEKRSPYTHHEAFMDIMVLGHEMHEKVQKTFPEK